MNLSYLEHLLAGLEVALSPARYLRPDVTQALNIGTACVAGAILAMAWFAHRRGDGTVAVLSYVLFAAVWPALRIELFAAAPRLAHREIEMQAEASYALLALSGGLLGLGLRRRPRMLWLLAAGVVVGLVLSVCGNVLLTRAVSLGLLIVDAWLISQPLSSWLLRDYRIALANLLLLPCRTCVTLFILAVFAASLVPATAVREGMVEAIKRDPGPAWVDAVTHEPLREGPSPILSALHKSAAERWLFPAGILIGTIAPRSLSRRRRSAICAPQVVVRQDEASAGVPEWMTRLSKWCIRSTVAHFCLLVLVSLWPVREPPPSYESVRLGFRALQQDDLRLAEKLFDTAIQARATNAWAYYALGQVHARMAKKARAEWQVSRGDKAAKLYSQSQAEGLTAASLNFGSAFAFLGEIVRGHGNVALMPPSFIATPWTILPGVLVFLWVLARPRRPPLLLVGLVASVGIAILGSKTGVLVWEGVRWMHGL